MQKKYKNFIHGLMLTILLAGLSCAPEQNLFDLNAVQKGKPIVTVNNTVIHEGLLDVFSELNPRIKTQLINPLTRQKIVESLVDQQLLYQEALKRNLHRDDDVIIKSLLNSHVIISNALIENELEQAMKKAYEERKEEQFTRINVSLIGAHFKPGDKEEQIEPTPAQEKQALEKIQKVQKLLTEGKRFEELAGEYSDDKPSSKKEGAAGEVSKSDKRFARRGLEEVVTTAFTLKKDEVSGPVKTKLGYYLVKVTSDPEAVPFENAQRVLQFELQGKIRDQLIADLRKQANVIYAEADAAKEDKTAEQTNSP